MNPMRRRTFITLLGGAAMQPLSGRGAAAIDASGQMTRNLKKFVTILAAALAENVASASAQTYPSRLSP